MPAYEYICDECHLSFNLRISYALYGKTAAVCPRCGSTAVTRCFRQVRIGRSEETRMQQFEELADARKLERGDEDPAEIGRMMRTLNRESGAEMGESFNEVVDRLEHGQTSAEIEKDLPDLDGSKV